MIIAHNEFGILEKLIRLLDHPENDIFIHIDKKAKDFDSLRYASSVTNASLKFIRRRNVSWAAYSIIQATMDLLVEATKTRHAYYHLLSGVDLPIKDHRFIMDFFERNSGREFMGIHRSAYASSAIDDRIRYYHLFQEYRSRERAGANRMLEKAGYLSVRIQKALGVDRIRQHGIDHYKGDAWFSITHDFAEYVLSRRREIERNYRWTQCSDESVFQTLAMASNFRERIVETSLRFIDWDRGRPYTFTADDYETLIGSEFLWARKFSEAKDSGIVRKIYRTFAEDQNSV